MQGRIAAFAASVTAAAVLGLAVSAGAAEEGKAGAKKAPRYGLGVNLNRVDVRFEMDSGYAIDGFLGFGFRGVNNKYFMSTDLAEFTIGGYYLQRLTDRNPVGLHVLGGLALTTADYGVPSETDFALFGGLGCEYYLPGTSQLSLEGQIGLGLHFMSAKNVNPATGTLSTGTGTELTLGDLTGGILMLRYYFK